MSAVACFSDENTSELQRGKLTGAPYKRYVELGEDTHTIIMEKNRMNLFREVQLFLDEKHAPAR